MLRVAHDGMALRNKASGHRFKVGCRSDKSRYKEDRIILLVRDPRDVVVSAYKFMNHFAPDGTSKSARLPIDAFARSRLGIKPIVRFLNSWAEGYHAAKDFVVFYYESFLLDTIGTIKELCQWCGLGDIRDEDYEYAVEGCSFENMQKWNKEVAYRKVYKASGGDRDSLPVRRGEAGVFVDYLSSDAIKWMNAFITANLSAMYKRDLWVGLN
jgi:hypothetical protein